MLATRNPDKGRELAALLGDFGITIRTLAEFPDAPDVIEDGETCEANAAKKARVVALYTKQPAVADDTGLMVEALNGRPGVFAARYAGEHATYEDNWRKLLRELSGVPRERRGARFVTVAALADPEGKVEVVQGVLDGLIADAPAQDEKDEKDEKPGGIEPELATEYNVRELVLEPLRLDDRLPELCEAAARDPRCKPGVTVRCHPGAGGAVLEADAEQLRQVWLNLATNAFEAMPAGGTLVVRSRETDNGRVVVEFIDNGPGIATEDLSRVGQPFFTTKRGGTGLGVAIAQRIVERHGGTLEYESTPGRGTTARVSLPLATAPVAQAA